MGQGTPVSGAIGRAATVLVYGQEESAVAMVSAMIAEWSPTGQHKLSFNGPVGFDPAAKRHIRSTVLQVLEDVCQGLGIETGTFGISGVNLGAASSHDIGLQVSGFSADLPLFLAMLSARLGLSIRQDLVSTGHIASRQGDIRMVHNLAAKIAAAVAHPGIEHFILPRLEADESVATLEPEEYAGLRNLLDAQTADLHAVEVHDVAEIVRLVFSERMIVAAALDHRYAEPISHGSPDSAPVRRLVSLLGAEIPERFLRLLEAALIQGDGTTASSLLEKWASYHTREKQYPKRFGHQLRDIVQSIPPLVRDRELSWPLISIQSCIALSQCAQPEDYEDVLELYQAAGGARPGTSPSVPRPGYQPAMAGHTTPSTLTIVMSEIEPGNLARKIGIPIDTARATFTLQSIIAGSRPEALDTVNAFYCHLQRYIGRSTASLGPEHVGPDAFALLERAFANQGGATAALSEALSGGQGGLRFVLDQITEHYKRLRQEEYVLHVVKTAIDPTNPEERNAFMREFFNRFPDAIPPECRDEPMDRFSARYEQIIRAHVESMERVKHVLRGL